MNIFRLYKMQQNPEIIKNIIIEAEDIHQASRSFLSEAALFLRNTFSENKGPKRTKRTESNLVQTELKNSGLKVEVTKEILKESRKRQESVILDMKENNGRMEQTLIDLKKFNRFRDSFKFSFDSSTFNSDFLNSVCTKLDSVYFVLFGPLFSENVVFRNNAAFDRNDVDS
jgi:hypothetical protein